MILCCRCGHIWQYTGKQEGPGTSCPNCKGYVSFQNQVDTPISDLADYSGAEYIGVTKENKIIYYDQVYDLLVSFLGEPYPFSRSEESPVGGKPILELVEEIDQIEGWKFLRDKDELKTLTKLSF